MNTKELISGPSSWRAFSGKNLRMLMLRKGVAAEGWMVHKKNKRKNPNQIVGTSSGAEEALQAAGEREGDAAAKTLLPVHATVAELATVSDPQYQADPGPHCFQTPTRSKNFKIGGGLHWRRALPLLRWSSNV